MEEMKRGIAMEILMIEDNEAVCEMMAMFFENEGWQAVFKHDGKEGLETFAAADRKWDMIILDLNLPSMDGMQVCREARKISQFVPIIMLTARDSESDQVIGLEIGAFRGAVPRAQVGLAFAAPPLRLEVAGMFAWGGRITAPSVPTAGGELWLAGGSLSGCFERALEGDAGGPSAALCAFFEAAAVRAASFGVTSPDRAAAPWIAPGAQLLVRWPFTRRAALRLDVALAIPVVELSFNIEGLGLVHRIGAVSGRSGLGVELDIF